MSMALAENRTPFNGCKLSLQLNGLNVLTLEESGLIQAVLSFIGQNENEIKGEGRMKPINAPMALEESDARYVKIVVFDEQNRVLTVKSKSRFVLPGGRVEWDDDDAEAAARREVFEVANISLGVVKPVTVVRTRSRKSTSAQTIVFVARINGTGQASNEGHRFVSKGTFFETPGGQSDLVRSLVESAHRLLVSEEIRDEHQETTRLSIETRM